MSTETDPLNGPPPQEVSLPRAPLVRVIGQVRFSSILAVRRPEYIEPFQETIRDRYPVLRQEHAQSITLGPQGAAARERQVAWRFAGTDDAWRVSLTPEFVALETTAYSSRDDFLERMQAILDAVAEHFRPAVAERVGLRYIDRVTGDELRDIPDLIRPELLGIVKTPLREHAQHELSEALLALPNAGEQLRMRWAHLPSGATVDPNAVEPISERSWILDIDMFSDKQQSFEARSLGKSLRRFAERIYTVFRWAVTDEFLRRYGGTL